MSFILGFIGLIFGSTRVEALDIMTQIRTCHEVDNQQKRLACYDILTKEHLKSSSIEFINLVKIFSFDEKDPATLFGWDIGVDNQSIKWLTQFKEYSNGKYESSYFKKGKAIVSVNGAPCKLGDGTDMYWDILLTGPRSGVSRILIRPRYFGDCRANFRTEPYSSAKELGCDTHCGAAEGDDLYQLNIRNKKTIFLSEQRSCGSGGCSFSYHIGNSEDTLIGDIKARWKIK